jgi:hypothetical protein
VDLLKLAVQDSNSSIYGTALNRSYSPPAPLANDVEFVELVD